MATKAEIEAENKILKTRNDELTVRLDDLNAQLAEREAQDIHDQAGAPAEAPAASPDGAPEKRIKVLYADDVPFCGTIEEFAAFLLQNPAKHIRTVEII